MLDKFILPKISNDFINNFDISYPKEANRLICRYDGMLEFIENPNILTTILSMQEAVKSSNIEGTIATISDILDHNVSDDIQNKVILEDIEEIKNYEEALKYVISEITDNNYNFSLRLFKNIQAILLNNVRGKDKLKGEFKTKQNYIGNKYDNKITYMPVAPILTNDYMENLVEFINDKSSDIDPLVKIAIIHAQFELIHPFEDGNGRVGRIIIPLLLKKYKIIENHFFYISYFFAKNRDRYVTHLENISSNNDWNGWINFFIEAVTKQSLMLISMLKDLNNLIKDTKLHIRELKTIFAVQIVDFLFEEIKFNTSYFIKKTNINSSTARFLLKEMVEMNIISVEKAGSGTKSNIYRFDALYDLIKMIEK